MWEQSFLEEFSALAGLEAAHVEELARLRAVVQPAFPAIVDAFYGAVLNHPGTTSVFADGDPQIERMKAQLLAWLDGLFQGHLDAAYVQRRARIGRTHVRIRLEQRYMFAAMNVLRAGLHRVLASSGQGSALGHDAIDKIIDFELAVMLETYSEDYARRMRDNERLATLGQVAGFIGHELRNPLAVMETSLHLLRKRIVSPDENLTRHLTRLGDQLASAATIISDLLELARDRPVVRASASVKEIVEAAVAMVQRPPEVELEVDVDPALGPALVDERQIKHLLSNLVTNAVQAVGSNGVQPFVGVRAEGRGTTLRLVVEDNGAGIAEEVRHRLFEPLYTTRAKGLGLGLALCRRIAERHAGEIRVEPRLPLGTRFSVLLPLSLKGEA